MALTTISPALQDTQAQYTGFKNRIINGAMMIDQRNAGASVTPANGANTYTLDRWGVAVNQSSKLTVQQSTTAPAGFTNSLLITSSSAYSLASTDYFVLAQRVEGFNTADFAWGTANAQPVTVSFKVRSSLTGTFGGVIRNSASNRFYPFSYTINSANTFEDKTVTLVGDTTGTWLTNNGTGLELIFSVGVGSAYSGTAGAWTSSFALSTTGATSVVGTNGATFYITGVQLEKGSTATSFDYRPYGTELQLCQRYFQIEKGGYGYANVGASAWVRTGTTFIASQKHTVPMRAQPTGVSLGAWYAGDAGATNYQIGTVTVTVGGASIYTTTMYWEGISGGTFNAGGCCNPNAGPSTTGGYSLSAEL